MPAPPASKPVLESAFRCPQENPTQDLRSPFTHGVSRYFSENGATSSDGASSTCSLTWNLLLVVRSDVSLSLAALDKV